MDVVVRLAALRLQLDFRTDHFVDISLVLHSISAEYDLLSALVLMLWVPLLRYLRILPVIGPTVVAILLTITHSRVVLYLATLCFVILSFALSFQVAFGREMEKFADLTSR
jgi:hypothetical protein